MSPVIDDNVSVQNGRGDTQINPIKLDFRPAWDRFGYFLSIYEAHGFTGQPTRQIKSVEWEDVGNGTAQTPLINIQRDQLVELMDALWQCGIRPSNGEGDLGRVGAMMEHLTDLRSERDFMRESVCKHNLTIGTLLDRMIPTQEERQDAGNSPEQ